MPAAWMMSQFPDAERTNYCRIHMLGNVPETLAEFNTFYNARLQVLRTKIVEILAVKSGETE